MFIFSVNSPINVCLLFSHQSSHRYVFIMDWIWLEYSGWMTSSTSSIFDYMSIHYLFFCVVEVNLIPDNWKTEGKWILQSAQYIWWILLSLTWQDRDGDDNLGDDQPSNDDSHAADLPDTWHPANQRASWCRTDQSEAGVTLRRVSAISPHVSCHNIVTQRKSTRLDHCSFEDRFLVILINDVLSCFNEFGIYF